MTDGDLPANWRDAICRWATTHDRIQNIFLFGSRAKGNCEPDSDVDLAIVINGDDAVEKLAYSIYVAQKWRDETSNLLPVAVHLQFAKAVTDIVVWPAVLEHGQLLYGSG